jgi:hypothetical protein
MELFIDHRKSVLTKKAYHKVMRNISSSLYVHNRKDAITSHKHSTSRLYDRSKEKIFSFAYIKMEHECRREWGETFMNTFILYQNLWLTYNGVIEEIFFSRYDS